MTVTEQVETEPEDRCSVCGKPFTEVRRCTSHLDRDFKCDLCLNCIPD